MVAGGTVDDVALILGDDPDTVRKHYLKWSREYQERTTTLLNRVHGFNSGVSRPRHNKDWSALRYLESTDRVVAKVGVEPTR